MKGADITWTEATFKDFMANPGAKVPGTKMVIAVADGNAAANLWAYIKGFGPDGKPK
jgi:cytochrome c